LSEKIQSVKGNSSIKAIASKVKLVNDLLDVNDSKISNLVDDISVEIFSSSIQSKIIKRLRDIFDNYDKLYKDGTPVYNADKKAKIKTLVSEINDICDKNFWDRCRTILGIGT
jgi:hypothetical protein